MTALATCSINSANEMTEEYRGILLKQLAGQAYGELSVMKLYSKWISCAPGPREREVVAGIISEEVEHWSGVVGLMEDLGIPTDAVKNYQVRQPFTAFMNFLIPRSQWSDAVMTAFLVDRAGYFLLEDFAESSYTPLAMLTRETLAEEELHSAAGQIFTAEQVEKLGRPKMQKALRKWWPIALNMFGPDMSKYHDNCARLGLKRRTNAERRARFRADLEPRIRATGLEVPKLLRNRFPYM